MGGVDQRFLACQPSHSQVLFGVRPIVSDESPDFVSWSSTGFASVFKHYSSYVELLKMVAHTIAPLWDGKLQKTVLVVKGVRMTRIYRPTVRRADFISLH